MRYTVFSVLVAAASLCAFVVFGNTTAVEIIVCAMPIALVLLILAVSGTKHIKPPAWLTVPLACALWGACGGLKYGSLGTIAFGLIFGTVGVTLGIQIERQRKASIAAVSENSDEIGRVSRHST